MSPLVSRVRRARPAAMMALRIAALLSVSVAPVVASAQVVASDGGLSAEQLARANAQSQLGSALQRVAANGSDGFALAQAGRAALQLGDARAALGFLGRAEQLLPRDPGIKAALGAAMVQLEDPTAALRYFDTAAQLGGIERIYLADRGLAYDLLGDQARAQADYAVAMQSAPSAELTRRYALSLGISGQSDQAILMLAPLLRAQDRAAWRSRAMILAMNGRPDEARQIARTTMPSELAQGLDPYFALMDRLTAPQLAAASHFGRFPNYDVLRAQPSRAEAVRLASAAAAQAAAPQPAAARSSRERARNRRERSRPGENSPLANSRIARNDRSNGTREIVAVRAASPAPAPAPAPSPAPAPVTAPAPVRVASAAIPAPSPTPGVTYAAPAPAPAAIPVVSRNALPGGVTAPITTTSPGRLLEPAPTAPSPAVRATPVPPSQPSLSPPVAGSPSATFAPTPTPTPQPQPAAQPVVAPPALVPAPQVQPATPSASTTVIAGWNLGSVVNSLTVPSEEHARGQQGLTATELQSIADERRRQQANEAAERRRRQQAEAAATRARAAEAARAREAEAAAARERVEEEAKAREEAERRRRHPARTWVQIATGSDAARLASDCARLRRSHSAAWDDQSCATAEWGRTRRLVVGPFRNVAAARTWERAYKAAGGNAFVWTSEVGEEVTPVGRR